MDFARILLDIFNERKKVGPVLPELSWVHARSLLIAPYAFYAETLNIDLDALVLRRTMPAVCIFDLEGIIYLIAAFLLLAAFMMATLSCKKSMSNSSGGPLFRIPT